MPTKNRNSRITKLHLLKPSGPPSRIPSEEGASYQSLLEERVERIEREMKESVTHLQGQLHATLQQAGLSREEARLKKELARLTLLLEKRIQSVGEVQIHKQEEEQKVQAVPPKASNWKKLNHYLHRFFSLRTYRRFFFGVTRIEKEDFDEFGRDPTFEKKVKPIFDFLYHKYWRVSVDGLENIPNDGRGLIVANHSGTLSFDGSMIRLAVTNDHPSRRDVRFLVEDFVYYLPFVGTFMYRIGGVRASPDNAERLLKKGHLVTVFPEGEKGIGKTYKQRYHLQRFGRGGFIKLALKTGTPIIP